jgi:ABC-type uncharacterized transport system permease subunit
MDKARNKNILIEILIPVFAVLLSLIFSDLLILIYKESPFKIYQLLIDGTILNSYGFGQVIFKTTPLIFAGLAVAFAFRTGLFNIGGEGQLYMGTFVTGLIGYMLPASLPGFLAVIICLLGGFIGGAVVGFIPGYLKAKVGSHEVINTIMLNFIVIAFINYLIVAHFKVPETLHTKTINDNAHLARLSEFVPALHGSAASLAFIIAILACIVIYIILWKTKFGYDLRAVGHNPEAAETAGINVKKCIILSMSISGGLAGMIGINYVLGASYYFEEGFSSGLGFMGIAVALLGRNHPFGVIVAAFLFGILSEGGLVINAVVPKELVNILQAIVILCVVASTSEVRRMLAKGK